MPNKIADGGGRGCQDGKLTVGSGTTESKRKRAEAIDGKEVDGAEGQREAESDGTGVAKRQKRQTQTSGASLLQVCGVEVDILHSILNYVRSRFDYLRLGLPCKYMHRTMVQTPMHFKWFARYCKNGWFGVDGETERGEQSLMRTIDEIDAARLNCNFRDAIMVAKLCGFEESDVTPTVDTYNWAVYEGFIVFKYPNLLSCKALPASAIALLGRAVASVERLPVYGIRSKFMEPARQMGEHLFDVILTSRTNLFDVGDRLIAQETQHDGPDGQYGPFYLEALDARRRLVYGTFWWKIHLPNAEDIIDTYPFTSLFTVNGRRESTRRSCAAGVRFTECKLKIDIDGLGSVEPASVPQIVFRCDYDGKGYLDVLGGPRLPLEVHEITWAVVG
ncbi:hypothetical protein HK104_006428 [Borealophlyctis nickersoniae]|nr:hypothetical protein HK104_006428 [Borealophlyctis nickersoniae]